MEKNGFFAMLLLCASGAQGTDPAPCCENPVRSREECLYFPTAGHGSGAECSSPPFLVECTASCEHPCMCSSTHSCGTRCCVPESNNCGASTLVRNPYTTTSDPPPDGIPCTTNADCESSGACDRGLFKSCWNHFPASWAASHGGNFYCGEYVLPGTDGVPNNACGNPGANGFFDGPSACSAGTQGALERWCAPGNRPGGMYETAATADPVVPFDPNTDTFIVNKGTGAACERGTVITEEGQCKAAQEFLGLYKFGGSSGVGKHALGDGQPYGCFTYDGDPDNYGTYLNTEAGGTGLPNHRLVCRLKDVDEPATATPAQPDTAKTCIAAVEKMVKMDECTKDYCEEKEGKLTCLNGCSSACITAVSDIWENSVEMLAGFESCTGSYAQYKAYASYGSGYFGGAANRVEAACGGPGHDTCPVCTDPKGTYMPDTPAGFNCMGSDGVIKPSLGSTVATESQCTAAGGTVQPYTCLEANIYGFQGYKAGSQTCADSQAALSSVCCPVLQPGTCAYSRGKFMAFKRECQDHCDDETGECNQSGCGSDACRDAIVALRSADPDEMTAGFEACGSSIEPSEQGFAAYAKYGPGYLLYLSDGTARKCGHAGVLDPSCDLCDGLATIQNGDAGMSCESDEGVPEWKYDTANDPNGPSLCHVAGLKPKDRESLSPPALDSQ